MDCKSKGPTKLFVPRVFDLKDALNWSYYYNYSNTYVYYQTVILKEKIRHSERFTLTCIFPAESAISSRFERDQSPTMSKNCKHMWEEDRDTRDTVYRSC